MKTVPMEINGDFQFERICFLSSLYHIFPLYGFTCSGNYSLGTQLFYYVTLLISNEEEVSVSSLMCVCTPKGIIEDSGHKKSNRYIFHFQKFIYRLKKYADNC